MQPKNVVIEMVQVATEDRTTTTVSNYYLHVDGHFPGESGSVGHPQTSFSTCSGTEQAQVSTGQ